MSNDKPSPTTSTRNELDVRYHTGGEGSRRTETHHHTAAQSAFLSPLHQKTDSDAANG
jgi:hypothetical protein